MLLSECYALFQGDYESVQKRISKEEIIRKFLIRFLSEPSYDNMCIALEEGNCREAFRAVHSLKGISQNLGFGKLSISAGALADLLRGKDEIGEEKTRVKELLEQVSRDYSEVIEAIRRFEKE